MERGVETLAHVRPDSPSLQSHRNVFTKVGAVTDTTPWERDEIIARITAFEPHVVFGCLGTTRARRRVAAERDAETYDAIDYGLTSMLVEASAQVQPPPRFVYLSSLGVRDKTGSSYLQARYKLEQELLASGIPYTICRPAIISGGDRVENRPMERLGAVLGDALLGAVGAIGFRNARDAWASMTATQLATAMVNFALSADGLNRELDAAELRKRAEVDDA